MASNARIIAAEIIDSVLSKHRSLSSCAPALLDKLTDSRDRGLAQELSYGVLRWHLQLENMVSGFIKRPLKPRDSILNALLLSGAYQILHLRTPEHAAVSSAVEATRTLNRPWASGMINGILRNVIRQRDHLLSIAEKTQETQFSHPTWLIKKIQSDWPDHWQQILQNNNQTAPLSFRINQRQSTREDYLKELQKQGIETGIIPEFAESGFSLAQSMKPSQLPGFSSGMLSVQDIAAQLAAPLLDLKQGQRVLDACAAPGGKTAHILESQINFEKLVAIDLNSQRVNLLRDTLQRLNLLSDKVKLIEHNVADTRRWWDKQSFDRILLDAPCSATGVIRRHPDIKYHRKNDDITSLVSQQKELLKQLWPLLMPGGQFVYATCSVLGEENQTQIAEFLDSQTDATEVKIKSSWGHQMKHGKQILPGEQGMDGFYYACITKA